MTPEDKALLKQATDNMEQLIDENKEVTKDRDELAHHKLAYEVAVELNRKGQLDPEDFIATVDELTSHTTGDLQKRANALQAIDITKDLSLGEVSDEPTGTVSVDSSKVAETDRNSNSRGPESVSAAQSLVQSLIN